MALERQQKALQKFMLLLLSSLVLQQHFFKARIWVIRIRDAYFFIGFLDTQDSLGVDLKLSWLDNQTE